MRTEMAEGLKAKRMDDEKMRYYMERKRRKAYAGIVAAAMIMLLFTGCSTGAQEGRNNNTASPAVTAEISGIQADASFYGKADLSCLKGRKIGITIQSLQNTYWAGVMTALTEVLDGAGAVSTIVSCDDSSATQIGQIENFISAGCDLIMVHPSDAAAVEDVCAEARAAGIKVMCWDDPMENTDVNWILDNTHLGYAIGELAADFINGHFTEADPAEVVVIGYPQTVVLLERENGIRAALEEKAAGRYKIVASQAGIIASEAQTAVETILQAHPNVKVVAGVGAGAMIGADEALNIATDGVIPEDMGVFTTDVTKQQLEQLEDPSYPAKGIIGFEGSDMDTAGCCADMFALVLAGQMKEHNVFRNLTQITEENAAEIIKEMK